MHRGGFSALCPRRPQGSGESGVARGRVGDAGHAGRGAQGRERREAVGDKQQSWRSSPLATPGPAPRGSEPDLTPRAGFAEVRAPGVT